MTEPIAVKGAMRRLHFGPGPHPSGSEQTVHAGDSKVAKIAQSLQKHARHEYAIALDDLGLVREGRGWLSPDGIFTMNWGAHDVSAQRALDDAGIEHKAGDLGPQYKLIAMGFARLIFNTKMVALGSKNLTYAQAQFMAFLLDKDNRRPIHVDRFNEDGRRIGDAGEGEGRTELERMVDQGYKLVGRTWVPRHMGPGDHPSGSPQSVHAGNGGVVPIDASRSMMTNYGEVQKAVRSIKMSWPGGDARSIALSAMQSDIIHDEATSEVFVWERKHVVGVMDISREAVPFTIERLSSLDAPDLEGDKLTQVFFLASNEKGVGTVMMQYAIDVAAERGHGIWVASEPEAFGFYKHIGMKQPILRPLSFREGIPTPTDEKNLFFYFTADDIKMMTSGTGSPSMTIRALPEDAIEYEPEDGAFASSRVKKIPVERGGPGSGHHGHAGRPGKVGGSAPKGTTSTQSLVDSFRNDVTAAYEGQINGSLIAYDENGEYMGHIDWREFQGDVDIAWITVKEEMRRRGIATALVRQLAKDFEGQKVYPTMATREGTAFLDSIKNEGIIVFRHGVQKAVDRVMTALERLFE